VAASKFHFGEAVSQMSFANRAGIRRIPHVRVQPNIADHDSCSAITVMNGRAGYDEYRRDFAKLIWETASPKWNFDAATFDRSAVSFNNPDYINIVIHNYRWRLSLAAGEPQYDDLEKRLAESPVISVPRSPLKRC